MAALRFRLPRLRPRIRRLGVLAVVMAPLSVFAATLPPVDDASHDPSFVEFRNRLRTAIERKDAEFVLGIVAPDIKLSFGGMAGVQDFQEMWRPQAPDSTLWRELGDVIALGGVFRERDGERVFYAPYVFEKFWSACGSCCDHECAAVVGSGVRVRERPARDAPVLTHLTYAIVHVSDWRWGPMNDLKRDPWVQLTLDDGRTGFMARRFVRSPTDYRAAFAKRAGHWKMITFIAGD